MSRFLLYRNRSSPCHPIFAFIYFEISVTDPFARDRTAHAPAVVCENCKGKVCSKKKSEDLLSD